MSTNLDFGGFTAALGVLSKNLRGLAQTATDGLYEGIGSISDAAVQRLKELTPRSELDGDHIADGWRADESDVGDSFTIQIHNTSPKATEKLHLADGSTTDYTLLEILEYGSKAHEIRPVNGKTLHFTAANGADVHTQLVHHPGTKPYAMVAITEAEVAVEMKKLIDATRRNLALAFSRTGGTSKYLKGGKRAAIKARS